jgi:FkbM family methyltransferase
LHKIINWYTKRFRFPHRGWKFFRPLLKATGLYQGSFCKKLPNGLMMQVKPSEHIQQQLFWYGYYDKDAAITWEAFINSGAVVLDIGANIGYYSILAVPKAGSVYSFEPSKASITAFEKNIELNKITNISIQPYALSDRAEASSLYLSSQENSGMTGLRKPHNFSGSTEQVKVITLDDWMTGKKLNAIDIIKIDVEGAEVNVLKGAVTVLRQYQPVIFIEVINELLSRFEHTAAELFEFLYQFGYTAFEITAPRQLKQLQQPGEAYNIVFLPKAYSLPAAIRVIE